MTNYTFPHIENLSQVLPVIKDRPEFIVVNSDEHTVVNYVQVRPDTFPSPVTNEEEAILRECRGLIFDKETGRVVSRRFHKFFNLHEKPEETIDFSKPHVILEKLDGSMVTPLIMKNEGIRWATKMGITEVGMQVESWLMEDEERRERYESFAEACEDAGLTPIFEWIGPSNKIVLEYKEPNLILLAVRSKYKGNYLTFSYIKDRASSWGIPSVITWDQSNHSTQDLIEKVKELKDAEGIVICFVDGHMVKVKSDWYVGLHRLKGVINNERKLWQIVLKGDTDDLLGCGDESIRAKVLEAEENIHKVLTLASGKAKYYYEMFEEAGHKSFALNAREVAEPFIVAGVFVLFKNPKTNLWDFYKDQITRKCSNNKDFKKLKQEFNV